MNSNLGTLVSTIKDMMLDVDGIKERLEHVYLLKDALFDDLDERFVGIQNYVSGIKREILEDLKMDFDFFKEELLKDQEIFKKELSESLDIVKKEVKDIMFDFSLGEKESVSRHEVEAILRKLAKEDPEKFNKRSDVIDFMAEYLVGKVVDGESWYTIYKVIKSQL